MGGHYVNAVHRFTYKGNGRCLFYKYGLGEVKTIAVEFVHLGKELFRSQWFGLWLFPWRQDAFTFPAAVRVSAATGLKQ